MSIDPNLEPWQILGVAVKSEEDAAAFYAGLAARVRNPVLLEKLKFLSGEEERHRLILTSLEGRMFPDRPLDAPEASRMPRIAAALGPDASVADLFRAALTAEELSEAFYGEAMEKAADEDSRRMLGYLSRVERSHQAILRSEIDLLDRFPDYYNVEDFHIGQDLFHVGP